MIEIILPLPPSKNVRTERKRYFNKRLGKRCNDSLLTSAVIAYRLLVKSKMRHHVGKLLPGQKIIVACVWYRENPRADVHNYHAELADAIAPALGLNDKWFLIRDMDMIDVPKGEGRVWVQMSATGEVIKA